MCSALVVLPIYVPPLSHALELPPPNARAWAVALLLSVVPLAVSQIAKAASLGLKKHGSSLWF